MLSFSHWETASQIVESSTKEKKDKQMSIVDVKKVEQNKRELFHKMMSLIPQEKQDEAIQIWVDVTFEQYWAGWEQGFNSGYNSK